MAKGGKGSFLGKLKLNTKFLIMYIFCVIMPLVITDVILFKSVFEAELRNQNYYREIAIEAYINYLDDLLNYDHTVATAVDLNKNLNTFINTEYETPYNYYNDYVNMISNSFFSTVADLKRDTLSIYSDNQTMLKGNYFQYLSAAKREAWYDTYIESGKQEAVYAYYDYKPVVLTTDRDRFIYVRRMTNTRSNITKIVTIEHKKSRIAQDMDDIPVNCSMFLCCDDYVIYSNVGGDYQTVVDRVSNDKYMTVREYQKFDTTFHIYAFSDELTIMTIMKNNTPVIILIIFFTLLIPILIMKLLERSITDRIKILENAFGEGDNEFFRPIKEIKGTDEISSLMHNYNRIVGINNELTNTIYKDKLREQESDIARKNAELLALQSQINPHFLFNALESIRMHSILKGEDETAEMVEKLAVMERQNVDWQEDSVTIGAEAEFIEAYLQLQSYRFGDRLSFDIDIEEGCENFMIPKLTLVTFVENACVHGIESKSSQGWIFVRVYKDGDQLVIEVEDTGDGMEEEEVALLQQRMNSVTIDTIKKAKHVGILNACLRIKMMFKDKARFAIESEKGIGMSVIIMIPADMITTAN